MPDQEQLNGAAFGLEALADRLRSELVIIEKVIATLRGPADNTDYVNPLKPASPAWVDYELDDCGEADNAHFFCSKRCAPDTAKFEPESGAVRDTGCETCGRTIIDDKWNPTGIVKPPPDCEHINQKFHGDCSSCTDCGEPIE